MDITGNTVFIPGATSGIGLALALRLQDAGNTVIVGGRRTDELQRLAAQHGFATVTLDTTDTSSVSAARDRVLTDHPGLNVLIAMAGISIVEDVPSGSFLSDAERMVETNVLGPLRLLAAFIQHLRTRPDATVMTVSSGLAFTPFAATPTYNGTKAFIHQYSESIRLQLTGTSVRVVELVPPAVRTDLMPGQSEVEQFMPVDVFVDETLALIEQDPEATEILVETVKFLRFSEAENRYAQTVAAINAQA
ncbi:SDR family NAD(P)-dependent oxidoreductase [Curtobacterium sp. MCPF17_050]|uniref:SDR family oxidoreductase n=1 Tax=Curtobacterium sp. MCPF17_050 TaxID=2175664 RepID=UPI000D98BB44|nr:SDR family NAD(P)-dependent oxidoreductase [Curtobacterium sp. MCPF17_050]WIB15908.1 SDR family NAD(P)-dependent oxidoreductase [Curtobacterium sp. MCPF17_050]